MIATGLDLHLALRLAVIEHPDPALFEEFREFDPYLRTPADAERRSERAAVLRGSTPPTPAMEFLCSRMRRLRRAKGHHD